MYRKWLLLGFSGWYYASNGNDLATSIPGAVAGTITITMDADKSVVALYGEYTTQRCSTPTPMPTPTPVTTLACLPACTRVDLSFHNLSQLDLRAADFSRAKLMGFGSARLI